MAMSVALISCGKNKRDGIHRAKDLYTSPRFAYALQYGDACFDKMFILSAYYGLVKPETRLHSYDATLADMPINERRSWARRVVRQIRAQVPRGSLLTFICPKAYYDPLAELLRANGYGYFVPFKGLNRGQQFAWLKRAMKHVRWLREEEGGEKFFMPRVRT